MERKQLGEKKTLILLLSQKIESINNVDEHKIAIEDNELAFNPKFSKANGDSNIYP